MFNFLLVPSPEMINRWMKDYAIKRKTVIVQQLDMMDKLIDVMIEHFEDRILEIVEAI